MLFTFSNSVQIHGLCKKKRVKTHKKFQNGNIDKGHLKPQTSNNSHDNAKVLYYNVNYDFFFNYHYKIQNSLQTDDF